MTKQCTKCEVEKPASSPHFYPSKTSRDKLFPWCAECRKKRARDQRLKPIPSLSRRCWLCEREKPRKSFNRGYSVCKECQDRIVEAWLDRNPEYAKRAHERPYLLYRLRLKLTILHRYGGRCACCGEDREEFLSIDHVNGGGNKHRKSIGKSGGPFYGWLRRNGNFEEYRVLCHNCNMSLSFYGTCPHKTALLIANYPLKP